MIHQILSNDIWLMEATYLKHFMETAASKDVAESLSAAASNEQLFSAFFDDDSDKDDKPYKVQNEMAIINIEGPLMKKARGFFARLLGIQSMEKIGENFNLALEDKDVKGIFLNINSPGGSADGTQTLADIIYAGRGQKPILTFADSKMTSAAYWIGSSADYIVLTDEITSSGSIGAVAVHREISKAAEEAGIKFTVFGSGDFKKRGNEFEALSAKDIKYIQSQIEFLHAKFLDGVSRNLGTPIAKLNKDARESKIFLGQQGIDAGLAHEILTKDQAFEKLRSVIDGKDTFTKTIIRKGGVKNMPEQKIAKLELKIEGLEADLKAKDLEIANLKSQIETQAGNMDESETALTELQSTNTELSEKIVTLDASLAEAKPFVEIGKKAIEGIKAEIKALSVKAKGSDYNEALVEKQTVAFGNDYESLVMLRDDLNSTMTKLFKKGDLNPDEAGTDADIKQKEYDIGRSIGSGKGLKVIQGQKNN